MKAARSHDYAHLIERWQRLAERFGWKMSAFTREGDYELWVVESVPTGAVPAVYASAGIHGDESAATEALLAWAGRSSERLNQCAVTFFPCLNPWGMVMNSRADREGRDLNRSFNDPDCLQVLRQLDWIRGRRFDLAVMLHEDYDGTGFYLYELTPEESWGKELIAAAAPWVGVESRADIDGMISDAGVVTREIGPELLELVPKHPEALFFALNGTPRCYTLETPSEHHIDARIEAHAAVLDRMLEMLLNDA